MKNYHIGLDIGTSSVGFAARDDENNLIRVKGKNVIGARLFAEGQTAAERRSFRTARRRYNRRKWRLKLLDDIFRDEIIHKDPEFFNRLKQSSISPKDEGKQYFGSLLFPDRTDSEYYHDGNQTIYHLRNRLINQTEQADIREVYLALRHIVKYRGNFLDSTPVSSFEASNLKLEELFPVINDMYENLDVNFYLNESNISDIESILLDNHLRNADKKDKLKDILYVLDNDTEDKSLQKDINKFRKDIAKEIISVILGYKFNAYKVANYDPNDGTDYKFSFADESSDDKMDELAGVLEDNQIEILNTLKVIYSRVRLNQIIPNGMGLSESMIAKYNRHHDQLKDLKKVIDVLPLDEKKTVEYAYTAYVGNVDGQKYTKEAIKSLKDLPIKNDLRKSIEDVLTYSTGHISNQDLCDIIKSVVVDKYVDDESFEYYDIVKQISNDIENKDYLLKQRSSQNGNIPHQVHQMELDKIIENQSKFYPFLGKLNPNDKRRHIAKYKISELVSFRVPYYVGPLITPEEQEKSSGKRFAWMKRKNDGEITPWNFEDMVDKEATASRFIKRLTVKDTYLLNEDVLPDNSLLYQQFKVLNELNVIKVNNKRLTLPEKQGAYNELFKKTKSVTLKRLKNYLISNHKHLEGIEVTGLSDGEKFNNALGTYIDFKKIFGDKIDDANYFDDFEKIVEWSTVFEDRSILKEKLEKDISWITPDEVKQVVAKRYAGWGRLSAKLLTGLLDDDGQRIIDSLWNESTTFMEAVSKPEIKSQIQENNSDFIKNTDIESVLDEAYTSPQNKKAIRQVYKIVKDIQNAMGGKAPSSIAIEFTRSPEDNGTITRSRSNSISRQYKELGKEVSDDLKEQFKDHKGSMDQDKFYLYFMQMGKDLYDGTSINIDDLNSYQIDHIVPQSFYKDDSFDNRVLTHYTNNQKKGNHTPLNGLNINGKTEELWNHLNKLGLISKKKLQNLRFTDVNQLSKYTKHGFVRRQLVETSQVIKLVANILSDEFSDNGTKIIEVKAKMNSLMRETFDLYKVRELNDYHHAVDAYLTTFVGGYLYNRYPKLRNMFVYGDFKKFSDADDLKDIKTFNFLHDITNPSDDFVDTIYDEKSGEVILDRKHAIDTIKKIYNYKYMLIVREVSTKSGQLFNQTIYSAKKANSVSSPISIKNDLDPNIYGYKSGNVDHHMVIVKINNKGKEIYKVVGIPLREVQNLKNAKHNGKYEEKLHDVVSAKLGGNVSDFRVIVDNVMYGQLIVDGNEKYTLGSSTYKYNAKQLIIDDSLIEILSDKRKISNLSDEEISSKLIDAYNGILNSVNLYFDLYDTNKFREKLNNGIDKFVKLPNFSNKDDTGKLEVLLKVLDGLHAGPSIIRIKELGLSTPLGQLQSPSGITMSENSQILYQSPSGLFERKLRLKDL